MMSAIRLDSVSPRLADSFRRASTAKRRRAAAVACELAVSAAGLEEKEVLLALDALRAEASAPQSLRRRLESLAGRFDDEYLRLDEQGEEARKPEALMFFSKARAVSAIVFALSENAAQLHEAIYEAMAALDNPAELERSIQEVLG